MVASDQAILTGQQVQLLSINTIRTLSIDGVQKANSGPSRRAYGPGSGGVLAVAEFFALRPARSALAQPRPFRAVRRARFDAALFHACTSRACEKLMRSVK